MQPSYTGPTVPIRTRCACGGSKTLPVWLVSETLVTLRRHLEGALRPEDPVMTFRCRKCKQIVVLTAADIYLVNDHVH